MPVSQYEVRVVEEYRWDRAQVSGREFQKAPVLLPASKINEEMRRSPLLDIRAVEPAPAAAAEPQQALDLEGPERGSEPAEPPVDATAAAERLAAEAGIDLCQVGGTGLEGRVLLGDVKAVIDGAGT